MRLMMCGWRRAVITGRTGTGSDCSQRVAKTVRRSPLAASTGVDGPVRAGSQAEDMEFPEF